MRLKNVVVVAALLSLLAAPAALGQSNATAYTDDFQSYGEHVNPTGWVDSAVGKPSPAADGLYKTWGDPTQGNKATNVVYGTKQSSGKADPAGRMGTFSTYTTKTFTGSGRFEYRGRFIRTTSDGRIGLTFFSSYPERDQYYLAALMPQTDGTLTMQLLSFGSGALVGTTDSRFAIDPNKWYRFAIQADSLASETKIRARFWLEGSAEPTTWSIEASDSSATRLTSGRIGMWAALKGDAYIDDIAAKSGSDTVPPTIKFFESGQPLTDGMIFSRDAAPEIRVSDDSSGVATITPRLNGDPFTSRTSVTTERYHELDVEAFDVAGNRATQSVRFAVDKSAPVVRVLDDLAPIADGAVLNHNVKLVIEVTDLTPVNTTVTLDGTPFTSGSVVTGETRHTVTATSTDGAGHTTTVSRSFTIDRSGPQLSVSLPKLGTVLTETTVVITGSSDDAVTMTVNGVPVDALDTAAHTFRSKPVALAEGDNTVVLRGVDAAGNEGKLAITLPLDTRAPQITIENPTAGQCFKGRQVLFDGRISDEHLRDVVIEYGGKTAAAKVDATGTFTASIDNLEEGELTFVVRATDSVGHVATQSRLISIDLTAPNIDIEEGGATFLQKLVNRPVLMTVTVRDADPRPQTNIQLDGAAWLPGTIINTDGTHSFVAKSVDCAGNPTTTSLSFVIDTKPPIVSQLAPSDGAVVGAAATVRGSVNEAATVSFVGSDRSVTTTAAGSFELALPAAAEGTNRFLLRAADEAGNEVEIPYSFTLRTTPPAVVIVEDGQPMTGTPLFNRPVTPVVRVSVPDAVIAAMLDGQPFTSGTTVRAEGTHAITATATDPVGHVGSASATFSIDTTPPVIRITSPADGAAVTGDTVTVTGTVEDAVFATVNGVTAKLGAGGSFSTAVPLEPGDNLVSVSARDRAGNFVTAHLSLTRSDLTSGVVITSPLGGVTNRRTTVVSGRVLTPAKVKTLTLQGKTGTQATALLTVSLDPTGAFTLPDLPLFDGVNTITASVTPTSGSPTTATATITADLTAPALKLLADGHEFADGERFLSATTLSLQASDTQAVASSELRIDGIIAAIPATVSNGRHTAVAIAADAAGNQTRVTRSFTVGAQGSTGCVLTDLDPTSGAVVAASAISVTGRSGGAAGVVINGVPAQVANGSFVGTVELTRDGVNAVSIQCADSSGARIGEAQTLEIVRATSAPTVTITTPNEMQEVATSTVAVTGTVGAGVTSVDVNGKPATLNGSTFSATVNLISGLNVLVARAKNAAGAVGLASRRVVWGGEGALSISSPAAGSSTGASSIDISGTFTNVDAATLHVTPTAPIETHATSDTTGTFVVHGVPMAIGTQTVNISGTDRRGKTVSASVDISRLAGAPSMSIDAPADNSFVSSGSVDVTGHFVASSGANVEVAGTAAAVSADSFSGPASLASTGVTPLVARVTQTDGASAIATVYVTRLASAPVVRKIFPDDTAPADPGVIVLVSFSAPMDRSSLDEGVILLDDAGNAVSGQRRLDRDVLSFAPATVLSPGHRYTAVVRTSARDLAGNAIAQETRGSFTIASTAPAEPPHVDPIANAICGSTLTIRGTAPPSSHLAITIGPAPQGGDADATGKFAIDVNIPAVSGFQVARVRVVGSDGSLSPEADVPFQVDCAGPTVVGAAYDRDANVITVALSKAINISSASGAISLKLADGMAVPFTVAAGVSANVVAVTPSSADARNVTLLLTIATSLKDTTGRTLVAPFSTTFALGGDTSTSGGNGQGYVTGHVLDETTGRPVAGVTVAIGAVARTTDATGNYTFVLDEGAYTIHASGDAYTDVWRQVVLPAGSGVIPIDIRLAKRGVSTTATNAGVSLTHGGDDAITVQASLVSSSASTPDGTRVTLTAVGAQSLAGLLPLGWSPVAAAEVRVQWSGARVANAVATLAFTLPAAAASSGRSFVAVAYDEKRDEWRVLDPAVPTASNTATVNVTMPESRASYALVYPDSGVGLAAPAVPATGGVLAGVTDPCTSAACTLTASDLKLSPAIVPPNGRTVATLLMDGAAAYPSGTAVQAFVNEDLTLVDGSVESSQPFSTDLVLYRSLGGSGASAAFHLAPSARAADVPLKVGFDHIQVVPYPGRLDRGTIVGPAGGPIPADDRIRVDLPTGAAAGALHASAQSLGAQTLATYSVAGFDVVAGFDFTVSATDPSTSTTLLKSAVATFTVDRTSANAPLIVAEVVGETSYGRIVRMIADVGAPQSIEGAQSVRVSTAVIDPATLPLDGIVHSGRYLLLAAKQPIAFAFGGVRFGAQGAYVSAARVDSSSLGVSDLSRVSGLFVVPVIAAPAAPFALTPAHPTTGTGAPYVAPNAPNARQIVAVGDLLLASQRPQLRSVTVMAGSRSIDLTTGAGTGVDLSSTIAAMFTQNLDGASVASSAIVVSDSQGRIVPGATTLAGATLTWKSRSGFTPGATYRVAFDSALRGSFGAPLGTVAMFSFSTSAVPQGAVRPELIHITIPDANGIATITGENGALPPNWSAIALRRGRAFTAQYQTGKITGPFTLQIGSCPGDAVPCADAVTINDQIDLQLLNDADNIAGVLHLGPFISADHRAVVTSPDQETSFTTADGVTLRVPAGSFDMPTTVTVKRLADSTAFSAVPNVGTELGLSGGVKLDFSCGDCVAKHRLDVTIPVPAGTDTTKRFLLGWLGDSVRGPRIMIVDTLRVDGGNFTTALAAGSSSTVTAQKLRIGTSETATGVDVKTALMGANRSGVYGVVNINVPAGAGLGWIAVTTVQHTWDLFWDQFVALFASREYVTESRGRVVIPVLTNRPFELVGYDAGTGLQAFSKVYNPLPNGDPGVATVVESPETAQSGPYPLFAQPNRVEVVDLNVEDIEITTARDFKVKLTGGTATVRPLSTLPNGLSVSVFDLSNGSFISVRQPAMTLAASLGDRLVIIVGARDVDPSSPITIVFSRPLFAGGSADADAVNAFLRDRIKLDRAVRPAENQTPQYFDSSSVARYSLDSGGRRLTIELPSELERGAFYRIRLKESLAAAAGDQAGVRIGRMSGAESAPSPFGDFLDLVFQVRDVPDRLTSFQLRQDATTSEGGIRDMALNGNVLLMSAGTGGILAYDVSDPASLTNNSLPIGRVSPGPNEYWAIASDQHGRIYATGINGVVGFLQSYRLEDLLGTPTNQKIVTSPKAAALVSWVPGSTSTVGGLSDLLITDRPEGLPRKLQLAVQDEPREFYSLGALQAGLAALGGSLSSVDAGDGFSRIAVTIPRQNGFPYATQRITVENVTRDLRWSADATLSSPASFVNVVARATDHLRIVLNQRTYGIATIFGYGVGVWDLNAMESNDVAGSTPVAEKVRLTQGRANTECNQPNDPTAIESYEFSPEVAAGSVLTPDIEQPQRQLQLFGADVRSGVLDVHIPLPSAQGQTECDDRGIPGLLLTNTNPRIARLETAFLASAGRMPLRRFGGVQVFHWTIEAGDNIAVAPPNYDAGVLTQSLGQRGSIAGQAVERDYLIVPAYEYGLLIIDATSESFLSAASLADVIWIPGGAVAARVIPRTHYATVVDASGRVLLVDLGKIDERWNVNELIPAGDLFPTALASLNRPGSYGVGAPDPRILWTSEPGVATGSLAPVVDPDTGILFAGELQGKNTTVRAIFDPRIQLRADIGKGGLAEIGGVVPLGVDPPSGILNNADPNASLAAFRFELTLPGAIANALAGSELRLAVESERVANAPVDQTTLPFPRAHLRTSDRDGNADARPASIVMRRDLPAGMDEALRSQHGFNHFISPWIVAIADPRANAGYDWLPGVDKEAAGCHRCDRPASLAGRTEAQGVFELWSAGRSILVRPEICSTSTGGCVATQSVFSGTNYAYLGESDRLTTRVTTVMADTIRPPQVRVAAQTPPVADGALQETTYVHSGEVETGAVDLDAGGRSGWNVVIDRTYRSRTLGGTPFGLGWESSLLRRLRVLPDGNVEYRDGAGELWTFTPNRNGYRSPAGYDSKLVRTDRGWQLFDQKWRFAHFDELGRLSATSDEFANPATPDLGSAEGNVLRYLYDDTGRLAQIVDSVGRITNISYWAATDAATAGAYPGCVKEVVDWRGRKVSYGYDAIGNLVSVKGPQLASSITDSSVFTGRPETKYGYLTVDSGLTTRLDFGAKLKSITDPAAPSGEARVTFSYNLSSDRVRRGRVEAQTWATGESATFAVTAGDTFPTQVMITDALGQKRVYELTNPTSYDARMHIRATTLVAVPVVQYDTSLVAAPVSATPTTADLTTEVVAFDDDGNATRLRLPTGREVSVENRPAAGQAAGLRPEKITDSAPSGTIVTTLEYDTRDGARNNVLRIGRSEGTETEPQFRDAPTPARSRKTTEVADEDVTRSQSYDDRGRLVKNAQSAGGAESHAEEYEYYADDAPQIARGRVARVKRAEGAAQDLRYNYESIAGGGERVTMRDAIQNAVTVIERDALDRPVHRTARDGEGILADESFAYDANGQLVYSSREQRNVGPVISRMTYDRMLRPTSAGVNGAAVGGVLSLITTKTTYDLANRKVSRTDPFVSAAAVPHTDTFLDALGRVTSSVRTDASASRRVTQFYFYDRTDNVSLETDGVRTSVAHVHDEFGRETVSVDSMRQRHEMAWDKWAQPFEERWLVGAQAIDSAPEAVGHLKRRFTRNGELRQINEELIAGTQFRQTRFGWSSIVNGAPATSSVRMGAVADIDALLFGSSRMTESTFDAAGRQVSQRFGEATGISGGFSPNQIYSEVVNEYNGALPTIQHVKEPRAGATFTGTTNYDALGRAVTVTEPGGFTTARSFDEAGNVLSTKTSGHTAATTANYDSRGLATTLTRPDEASSTLRYTYDVYGNVTSQVDELGETTTYQTDSLGRVVKTTYPDSTCEMSVFENGSGFLSATRDRAGQWLVYEYVGTAVKRVLNGGAGAVSECAAPAPDAPPPATAPLLVYTYDTANRIKRIANANAAVEYDEYDLGGRAHITRSIRYRNGSGLTTADVLDVHTQRHLWSIFDGERDRYSMPMAGGSVPATTSGASAWRTWIAERHDAGGNLVSQHAVLTESAPPAGLAITEAAGRSVGRLVSRSRGLSNGQSITTRYGYAEPGSNGAPAPYSGMLGRAQTQLGDATIAGTEITRDLALRITLLQPAETATRMSSFSYDQRDRLTTSILGALAGGANQPRVDDALDGADVRTQRSVSRLTSDERSTLGAASSRKIELPSFVATPGVAHQIANVDFDGAAPPDVTMAFAGGRRVNDGTWKAKYDAFGRLVQLTRATPVSGAATRYEYDYNPANRLVGRRVCSNADENPCVLEASRTILDADGLPAQTTFVWDPVTDRLLSIFEAGRSSPFTGEFSGLLRQYIHGDQGYDDPVEVLVAEAAGSAPHRYLPVIDEAGTGNVIAVLESDGTVAERVLYGDSYGASPRYLQGPVVERITHQTVRQSDGSIKEVRFRVTLSDAIDLATGGVGAKLRSLRDDGSVAVTSAVTPTIDAADPQTLRWTLNRTEWATLAPSGVASKIELAVTSALHARAWGTRSVMLPAEWQKTLTGVRSTASEPVIEALTIPAVLAPEDEQTDFETRDLYTVAAEQSRTRLLTGFKAVLFVEPATGLDVMRDRWYDPATGTFLSPDAYGAIDSSNLDAYCGNDPVNCSDPTGMSGYDPAAVGRSIRNGGTWLKNAIFNQGTPKTGIGVIDAGNRFADLYAQTTVASAVDVGTNLTAGLFEIGQRSGSALFGADWRNHPIKSYIGLNVVGALDTADTLLYATGIASLAEAPARSALSTANGALDRPLAAYSRSIFSSETGSVGAGIRNIPKVTTSFEGTRFASADEFGAEAFARYQRYVDDAYEAALRAEARGILSVPEGLSRETVLGQRVDRAARFRMKRWLRSEGINEGPGSVVQVNRWLRDPAGSGAYRIPDLRIPGAESIMDATIGQKGFSLLQIQEFHSFSYGNRITIVRPTLLGGSYSLLLP